MEDTKFITKSGLKSARKAARHDIDGFLELVYFKEDVLKEYESHKGFSVGDNGTVLFGEKWGIFRGVYRVAKGYIAAYLGDLGEGLPDEELLHWKKHNVPPFEIPKRGEYFDFRDTLRRMVHFMNISNERVQNHIKKFYFDVELEDAKLFNLTNMESTFRHIKKIINDNTTKEEFQSRIIFLNILLLESINEELIKKVFIKVDRDLLYSPEKLALKEIHEKYLIKDTPKDLKGILKSFIDPLRSFRLLQKFLLLLRLNHDIIISSNIRHLSDLEKKKKEIYSKISNEFTNVYNYKIHKIPFKNSDYFLQKQEIIEEDTKFLLLLNQFRSESAAHGFNEEKYQEILGKLGFKEEPTDYSIVYERLISKVSYNIERIYFNLIAPDPPILDYYKGYLKATLEELSGKTKSYQYVFEELASYLDDFPEMYKELIEGVLKIHAVKKSDKDFILEFGCFIESISRSIKDKTQDLIEYILEGYGYEKALTIAHLSHIIKNSDKISDKFYERTYKFVVEALKDNTPNVDFCSQHVIFCLIQKCPEKLNKKGIVEALKGKKIHYDLIKKYFGIK